MKQKNPPRWALRLIRIFIKDHYFEQIEGDLLELFHRNPSRFRFAWNTLRFFRLRYLKGLDDFEQLTTLAMVKNYLKVAFRTLIRQKTYSSINIIGLAIGLASCLLITIYVNHERSYDDFFPESDNMYRILNGRTGGWTPPLLAETLIADVSEIATATRINGIWETLFEIEERSFVQDGAIWADPQFFHVFQTTWIQGDERALSEPNTVVLTASVAKKCFPDESPIGKTITIDEENHKVTGIVSDPPKNTHLPYQYIISSTEVGHRNWTGNSVNTYAKTVPGADPIVIEDKLMDFYQKYVGPEALEWSGHDSFEELIAQFPDRHFGFTLFPVKDIHLTKPYLSKGNGGDEKNIVIFSVIAIFILILACVNYINMTTARSAIRSKEVGIRKALGSYRNNIITQFIVESIVITLIAVVIALLLAISAIPYFNELTGRVFEVGDLFAPLNLLYVTILLIASGFLAGLYPAYVMSGFSPLKALRNQKQQGGKTGLRSVLLTFQFAVSVCLIAATVVVFRQLKFMQSQELGLNIDQTLIISGGRVLEDKYDVFKNELEKLPGIDKVGKASNIPFHGYGDWGYIVPNEERKSISPYNAFTSSEILDVLDIELVKGRFFMQNHPNDTNYVVINEAFVKEMGWEDPIGKELTRMDALDFKVVGVMKDFNYTSLKHEIAPIIFRYGGIASSEIGIHHQVYVLVKVSTNDLVNTLEQVEMVWNEYARSYPLDAFFMDDSFQRHYESERKFGNVFTTFASLAIVIAFMGLFALTTFVLQKRIKEIAIRKVLGATTPSLLRMLIRDFTKLVTIGGIVGIGISFYWLREWLLEYSYRIQLSWYLLVFPILLVLAMTWMVVSVKSYYAATANPSNALKEE